MDRAVEPTLTVAPRYQSGFGNHFATEALSGALPQGRNAPQRPPYGLYAEQFSGTAFTAPRHANRRSWLYRIRPAAVHGSFQRRDDGRITGNFNEVDPSPNHARRQRLARHAYRLRDSLVRRQPLHGAPLLLRRRR